MASKAALNMLTAMYAKELADTPIKVNAANPGYTATDFNDHRGFRAATEGAEPSLHGEYLKAAAESERALAAAIARRTGADQADLRPLVLAAVVVAAERAAILQWFRQGGTPVQLADMVRAAVGLAVRGPAAPDATLT